MKRLLLFLLPILFLGFSAQSQSIKELKERKNRAMKNLEMTNGLITKTQVNTKKGLTQLKLVNAEIKELSTVIASLNAETRAFNRQLRQLKKEAEEKQAELDELKKEYAELMYYSYYKKNKYDNLMFILSAKNFGESYRRMRYIKQYASHCKRQADDIKAVKIALDEKLKEVETARMEKRKVLNLRKGENRKLRKKKSHQSSIVASLKKKSKELKKDLKRQERAANRLNNQIEKKIEAEARRLAAIQAAKNKKAGIKVEKTAGKKHPTYALTKEEKLISGNFAKNLRRLPWPVKRGVIVGRFGIHQHPVLTHVTTNNKGVYIQTSPGMDVRSVFEGEVTQCFSIPGSNNTVIIKHGKYRTVYSNLTKLYVKIGDKVATKEAIGEIYTDEDAGKTELYFQVWMDRSIQNPENWLVK